MWLIGYWIVTKYQDFYPCGRWLHHHNSRGVHGVISDLTVFNHDAWPTDMEALLDFGREKVERLINWFKVPLVSSGCNTGAIQPQWLSLKILVHSEFMDKGYNDLWATLMTKEPYKSPSASLQRTISSSPKQGLKVAIIVIKCDAESSWLPDKQVKDAIRFRVLDFHARILVIVHSRTLFTKIQLRWNVAVINYQSFFAGQRRGWTILS